MIIQMEYANVKIDFNIWKFHLKNEKHFGSINIC